MMNTGATFMAPLASITTDWFFCECDRHGTSGLAQVDSCACPQWDSSFGGLFCPDPASCQAPTALVLLEVEGACAKPARVGART